MGKVLDIFLFIVTIPFKLFKYANLAFYYFIKLLAKEANNIELIIYGRIELMVTKYCPMNMLINKDSKSCNLCDINKYYLKDKDDNIYPLINEKHLTHILDSKPLDLTSNIKEYIDFGIRNYRLELYNESKEEIENLIKMIRYNYEHRNN